MSKAKIFVTNDDGIDSPGIHALVKALKEIADVWVVAPDRQQSAVGHAMTLSDPLRVHEFQRDGEMFGHAVSGTPSDCVKLALSSLLPEKPDLVVSGINHGRNTAVNILYSGTVSAATEATLSGIKSLAVSHESHTYDVDMSVAAEYAKILALRLLDTEIPGGTLINMNVPDGRKEDIKGIKVVRHADTVWKDKYEMRTDPFNRDYYWFAGEYKIIHDDPDTDDRALHDKYVAVTPIHYDITNYKFMNNIKHFEDIKH